MTVYSVPSRGIVRIAKYRQGRADVLPIPHASLWKRIKRLLTHLLA